MEGDEILDEIEEAQDKIEKLKDQRRKLIEANRTLLQFLEQMKAQVDTEEGFRYSFKDGWNESPEMHELKVEPGEYSEEELERQINEIIRTANNLENN